MIFKPILFNTEMVRAILEGRKTQMRRIVKEDIGRLKDPTVMGISGKIIAFDFPQTSGESNSVVELKSPYTVGQVLWVRETWHSDNPEYIEEYKKNPWMGEPCRENAQIYYKANEENPDMFRWKPSIYMPKWASRINLEITEIRVERLQDITEEDAKAEGVVDPETFIETRKDGSDKICPNCYGTGLFDLLTLDGAFPDTDCNKCNSFKKRFRHLWNSINEKRGYGWDTNPFVWVYKFRRRKSDGNDG